MLTWGLAAFNAVVFPGKNVGVLICTVYAILAPAVWLMMGTWELAKFNHMPGPIQLTRGFRNIWPVVAKGPVTTTVRARTSSRPTP
jgi:hypothetical protein